VTGDPGSETTKGDPRAPFFLAGTGVCKCGQVALVMRLLLMHCVQTRMRLGAPSTSTRTVWRLGYQRRFVRFFAWLTLWPVIGTLAQTAHTRAMV